MRFNISFALLSFEVSFFDKLAVFRFTTGFVMFLLDEEVFTVGGFDPFWTRLAPPVNLYIACFCFYFYAGENSLFFIYALEDLAEFQSFYLLVLRAGLCLVPVWLLFIKCEDTTGRTGGLYSVFLGISWVLMFGVVFNN